MSRPLAGLSFALSGFVNPERANLRQAGLDLGAKYHPDWTPTTDHLICAVAGTPKAIQVRFSQTAASKVDLLPLVAGAASQSGHTYSCKGVVCSLFGQRKKRE